MSTDFSIKPVGAPVAAPIVQPVSEAVQSAVATELPREPERHRGGRERARQHQFQRRQRFRLQSGRYRSRRRLDRLSGRRQPTSQVVKQYPEEAVLRRRAYFHTLDLTKRRADRACAPPTAGPEGKPSSQLWMRGVGRVEIGLPGRGIGDDVLDLCFAVVGQRELGVADPERPILDEHVLVLVGAVALVLNLGAKAGDVRDRDLERSCCWRIFRSTCPGRGGSTAT